MLAFLRCLNALLFKDLGSDTGSCFWCLLERGTPWLQVGWTVWARRCPVLLAIASCGRCGPASPACFCCSSGCCIKGCVCCLAQAEEARSPDLCQSISECRSWLNHPDHPCALACVLLWAKVYSEMWFEFWLFLSIRLHQLSGGFTVKPKQLLASSPVWLHSKPLYLIVYSKFCFS